MPASGTTPKLIREYVGLANSETSVVSVPRMPSPPGWSEPAQRPEFVEVTLVLAGALVVESDSSTLVVQAGKP